MRRRQAITWSNDDPVYQRIYAALGGDESMADHLMKFNGQYDSYSPTYYAMIHQLIAITSDSTSHYLYHVKTC